MEPMITAAPVLRGALLHRRDSSSSNTSGSLDTCGYLSGDYASPLTCGLGYTCSTGPSILPSHLGCCNAVDCAPSSGAHTCITAESGTIPCTSDLSTGCLEEYTSLLFCTDPTAPACVTYSQPPPSSGSAADAGLSPTIFSYSCGPTQTTNIFLATATNAPSSAPSHTPITISHLPIYAYVGIGIGGLIVLLILLTLWRRCTNHSTSSIPAGQPMVPPGQPIAPPGQPIVPPPGRYRCRHCGNTNLSYRIVQRRNQNRNAGRPYYVCLYSQCPNLKTLNAHHHDTGWVTWDDNIGVAPGNPLCRCSRSARQDTAGERSRVPGKHFWTCSTGACDYTSWRRDGLEAWGDGF